ncbi:MAG: trp operon repressor [Planctomycetaceae bacterium]|nr:trp operon repressor [Planctomycetaceae bacterium]
MVRNRSGEIASGYVSVVKALCDITDSKKMQSFLEEILTPAERRDLALRWDLMKRLKAGTSQRQIASELGISLCKITRGAKVLKNSESISNSYLDSGEENGSKNSPG